jgi:hypothetical protein
MSRGQGQRRLVYSARRKQNRQFWAQHAQAGQRPHPAQPRHVHVQDDKARLKPSFQHRQSLLAARGYGHRRVAQALQDCLDGTLDQVVVIDQQHLQ